MRPPLDLATFAEQPAEAPAGDLANQSGGISINGKFPVSRLHPGTGEQALARLPGLPGLPGPITQDRLFVEANAGAAGGATRSQFRAFGSGITPADRRNLEALADVRGFDSEETAAMLIACEAGGEPGNGESIAAAEALACWLAIAAEHAEAIASRIEAKQAERARRRCDTCRHLRKRGCANRQAAGLPLAWGAADLIGALPTDRGASCAAWSGC